MTGLSEELLGLVYEGPLEPEEPWLSFLQVLRREYRCVAASLSLRLVSPDDQGFDVSDADWDVRALRQHHVEKYYAFNPFPYADMEPGKLYRWSDFVDQETFRRSAYYREFCQPVGFEYALCLCLAEPAGTRAWLHLSRTRVEGDFSQRDVDKLQRLGPHFERALRLLSRLRQSEAERTVAEAAVEQLAIGTVILDARGNVLSHNRHAERILQSGDGLLLREQPLQTGNTELDQQLRTMISELSHTPDPCGCQTLALERPGQLPAGLLIRAFPRVPVPDSKQRPALIIYLTDPAARRPAPEQLVASLFDLTRAEARLAALLADGLSLAEAARHMHVSENSARSYSKRIFAKTGVSRQAELVKLVLQSVAALAPENRN